MMRIKLLFTALFVAFAFWANAAYLENIPRTLIQPNGDTLHCFATGDEFYLRLHDEKGFTIVKDKQTGYFVYADKVNGKVVPTPWIAGTCNPADKGLNPNVKISREDYLELRRKMVMPAKQEITRDENTNKGNMNNLVVFIRFADDSDFTNSFSDVHRMFNDSSENYTYSSMFNYFRASSYHQLFIRSHFYPQPNGDQILSYQDIHPRCYYQEYSDDNPDGYDPDGGDRVDREQSLLERACQYVQNMIPANLNIDYNNDGNIDNVVFVVRGDVGDWAVLLWPHRWSLYSREVYIHNKRVYDYNFQLADASGYFNNAVLCHEMFHTLSAPDLYHYSDDSNMDAVGKWDLMCSTQSPPQQSCAYMKHKYGNWIADDEVLPLDHYGRYTIMPLNSETPDRQTYYVTTGTPTELIMVDFRSQNAPFDSSIPGRGLIFYRINILFNGNASYNGDDNLDEVYVFRKSGSVTQNGLVDLANFRGNLPARKEFSPLSNPYPFTSNGDPIYIYFKDLTSETDSMQFVFTEWVSVQDYEDVQFTAYPNPSQELVTVEVPLEGTHTLQLYNLYGQLLQTVTSEEKAINLNLSSYPTGCYMVKVFDQEKYLTTIKIIKK